MPKRPKIRVTKGAPPRGLTRKGAIGQLWTPVESARDEVVPLSEKMSRAADLFEAIVPGQQFPGKKR